MSEVNAAAQAMDARLVPRFLDLLRTVGGPLRRLQGRPAGNGKSQPAQQEV